MDSPKKPSRRKKSTEENPETPAKKVSKKSNNKKESKKVAVDNESKPAKDTTEKKISRKKVVSTEKKHLTKTKKESVEVKNSEKNPALDNSVKVFSRLTDFDIELFRAGKHFRLYEKMGAHVLEVDGIRGTYFAVWAPNARLVSVIGNFNEWNKTTHTLHLRWDSSGIWEGFIPGVERGEIYKYYIQSNTGEELEKGDPFAFFWEVRPKTASICWDTYYEWEDNDWMENRKDINKLGKPFSVYEVHLGSWKKSGTGDDDFYNYRELADKLAEYVNEMGFTHVELMPVSEHPYDGSWGYQQTGYYAPTSRYGAPQDFMYLVEKLHVEGIGVIMDWVPSHFPYDAHGLFRFDGTHLYEHADMRKGYHPDWKSYIFNLGRNEVRSFLISNAMFWCDRYHIDGIRVDAVASMLYLDYSRKEGEWLPNEFGGRENLESVSFLKELNENLYLNFPDIQTIAEESTSWPGVSRPIYTGGLGFGMKWMMGWMNDTLKYFARDPLHRKFHQNEITFSMVYAFSENFLLPLSHDEVVHGKRSLLSKMPGDEWQRFANLRAMLAYMYTHPGAKLLFMGGEFGQTTEWNYKTALSWDLLQFEPHEGMRLFVKDLNSIYRHLPAMHECDFDGDGFEWIDTTDHENSILIYLRKTQLKEEELLVVLNLTPLARFDYRVGVNYQGMWEEILNSDDKRYWGSGVNNGIVEADEVVSHFRPYSICLTLPPLSALILKQKL